MSAAPAPTSIAPAVQVTGLTKRFGSFTAIDDVTVTIKPGRIHGLLGRNGAGKTTLMQLITGQDFATAGEMRVFGERPVQVDHVNIPTAVFSQPEIGTVGLTEAEALAQFDRVDIYKTDFRPIKSTMSGRDTRILMKLVVDGTTDRVVGCHIVGDAAAETIQAVAIAVNMKATKADFDATFALHPTAAEELVTMRTPTTRHVREAAAE